MQMKKVFAALFFIALCLCACAFAEEAPSAFEVLPVPEVDANSDFGTDVNVNMLTIDQYLGLADCAYRDMRMLNDPFDYEAIGGNSLLTGMLEGFTLVPYPYLAPCADMPEALGEGYTGPTLFGMDDQGNYVANYEESVAIMETLFPKDQAIILMCGAGGYASMTKHLLVSLGWDEGMLFNAGGFWFYSGDRAVELLTEQEQASGVLHFDGVDMVQFDFDRLTPAG